MDKGDEKGLNMALDTFLAAHPKSSGAWEAAIIRQAHRLMNGRVGDGDLQEVRRLQSNPLPGQETRARTLLGQYLLEFKRPKEVVDLIDPIITTEPTMINHFQLGSALVALKEREEGMAVLQEGLSADPGDLPEEQADLLRAKIQAMVKDLEKT
jgi:hypothetical protein